MDNRESREKTWTGSFQSSVRIEELESRQFLTAVVAAQHVEEVRADQVVLRTVQAPSETPATSGEQAAPESNTEASNGNFTASASRQAAVANAKSSAAAVNVAATDDSNSAEDAVSGSADDSASAGESRQTAAQEAEDATSATAGNGTGVERSLAAASTATSDGQLEPAAISDSSETIASSQLTTGGAAVFEDSGNSSEFALPTADAAPALFSNSPILDEHSGTSEPQPIFLAGSPGGGFSINSAGKLGNATAFAAAIFSSKPVLEQLSGALPAALANMANRAAELSKVTESGVIEAASAPFFFFPRINWAGALSDAWESFAQESAVLPLAEVGRVHAWVVTAAVGAADAVLVGYWIWSKRRRKTLFCVNLMGDNFMKLCD